ncbi:MAG: HmuY family protein, partial [Chitinophagales bacterium]|nr:HmuY family protein [Chitinophagales bacterium]
MKQKYLSLLLIVANCYVFGQTTKKDSVILSPQYKDKVFYKLSNGNKSTTSNTDWHLAFSVQKAQFPANTLLATTIRHNGANGVVVYQRALNDTAFFTGDTSGFSTFKKLYDSDINIDSGAFNRGLNISQFDYGWGVYNSQTRNIVGRGVYYIQINTGIKKFRIIELTFDTLWQIQYANLDNSGLNTVTISKRNFQGKLFAYLNLETGVVSDKEPNSNDWDLLFLKYNATDVAGYDVYPSVGVWSNKGVQVAEARKFDKNSNDYSAFSFSPSLSEIGRDWKEFKNGSWQLEDSLAYFVKDKNGKIYKIVFTGFAGSSTGKIIFNVTEVPALSILDKNNILSFAFYPNPATQYLLLTGDFN